MQVTSDDYTPTDWLPATEGGSNPEIRRRIFAMLTEIATMLVIAEDPEVKKAIRYKAVDLHTRIHGAYNVESLNDLTPEQVQHLLKMLNDRKYQLTVE